MFIFPARYAVMGVTGHDTRSQSAGWFKIDETEFFQSGEALNNSKNYEG
jgi:hypothetical protein